ncbi:MAG: hypothetical protein QG669_220 [Patescibacteria group bacterium]|nr:hypothetical protein [Patescibacteria group bacterium]MDQ5961828.1 hypothetical protein [Patescibacteria group bacterium]
MTQDIKSFRDLIVWQKSYKLVKMTYVLSAKLPKEEVYGLQSQIRRSCVSVPSNIAEGCQRRSRKDFCQFLQISYGSLAEYQTQLMICRDVFNLEIESELTLSEEVSKMLQSFIKKLSTSH